MAIPIHTAVVVGERNWRRVISDIDRKDIVIVDAVELHLFASPACFRCVVSRSFDHLAELIPATLRPLYGAVD